MSKGFWEEGSVSLPVDIALCICPHLQEFLVVDQRTQLPGRPLVQVLATDTVFDEEFYNQVEQEVSHALRQRESPFTTLMALPQVVQTLIRQRSLEAILRTVESGTTETTNPPRVAVLLFSGEILTLEETELAQTIQTLLGAETDEEIMTTTLHHLSRLLTQEQEHERHVKHNWLRKVIKGNAGDFFTLWEQSR